jgi:hypothetical protein
MVMVEVPLAPGEVEGMVMFPTVIVIPGLVTVMAAVPEEAP